MSTIERRAKEIVLALIGSAMLLALPAAPAYAIVGGSEIANPGYVAALVYRTSYWDGNAADREFCSGTLIAPQWVLTAAHCLKGGYLRQYEIILGVTTLSAGGGEVIRPIAQFIHPKYRGGGYDVGLVKLARPAVEPTAPIADGSLSSSWAPGKYLTVMGWGYTCPAETHSCQGDTLKGGQMRVRTDRDCAAAMEGSLSWPTEICTRTATLSLGGGDSGGPAVINTPYGARLVAVNSWGQVDYLERDVVGGWMGYAEVAGTRLATWVAAKMAAN